MGETVTNVLAYNPSSGDVKDHWVLGDEGQGERLVEGLEEDGQVIKEVGVRSYDDLSPRSILRTILDARD